MSNETLRNEISNDPLSRGYSTMTDSEVADDLNTEYRSRDKDSISGGEIFDHTDPTEFSSLNSANQDKWLGLCGVDSVDPFDSPAVQLATDLFPSGGPTLTALSDYRTESISRAEELGLGDVKPYDIEKARTQLGVA